MWKTRELERITHELDNVTRVIANILCADILDLEIKVGKRDDNND